MCGRFTQHYTWQEIHTFLSVFGPGTQSAAALQHCANRHGRRDPPR